MNGTKRTGHKLTGPLTTSRLERADRDVVALGIAVAAILLFVGTGSTVLPQIFNAWSFGVTPPDPTLLNALLLNIALVLFGWRRYRELSQEISRRRAAEEKARELAETDPLTGSLNRRSLNPASAAMIEAAHAEKRAVAALMLDLDNFKTINDVNGHAIGDQVLVEITRRIEALLPAKAMLARLGGDEFMVVERFDPRSPDRVDQHAASIIAAVSEPLAIDGLEIDATTSIGIARSDEIALVEGQTFADMATALAHRADIAMYHAKKHGRNRHCWFEPTMENELRFRNELETGIRRGVANGEFVPYYEQQIDLETGELAGFEMLARWQSPQLGLVSPEVFIPVAEDIGMIAPLSEALIARALQDARDWSPHLTLSVNISPVQLRDPWFAQKLLRLLVESGFPAERLEIEITESCLHENIGLVRSVVTSLKNQGVRISLDDFGTGYSSLAQLRSLPFDRIKIDRSFVSELGQEGGNAKIVEAIVSLGRGLELPVTAEGIESEEILERLKRFGELKGQGYLYGRPADATSTLSWLTQHDLVAPKPDTQPLTADEAAQINADAPGGTPDRAAG